MSPSIGPSSRAPLWWQPLPPQWSAFELLIMRAGFAALLFLTIRWDTSPYETQQIPNGLAHFFDLTWLARHPPGMAAKTAVAAVLLFYVAGVAPAIGLLPVTALAVLIATLVNSSGAINHSWQLVTLIALAQILVYAAPLRGGHLLLRPDLARHRIAAWAALQVIAAVYVTCAITKLYATGGHWILLTPNLAAQLMKTHLNVHYDTLQPTPSWLPDVTQAFLQHPSLARILFGAGLLIEMAGFVLLLGRRGALAGGLAIVALHLSISRLMNLQFDTHVLAVLLFAVNLPGLAKARRGEP